MNILDPYIPGPKAALLTCNPFTPEGRSNFKDVFVRFARKAHGMYLTKKAIKGWKYNMFAKEAEQKYILMNEAFAAGDKDLLKMVVTDPMFASMNAQLKNMTRKGQFVWQSHGSAEPPRSLNLTYAKALMEHNVEHKVVQITVRVNVKQSAAIYQGSKLVGGNPDDIKSIAEYIVLEKWLTRDVEDDWKIAGKINPPASQ